jgi:protein-S-isoprenylcysteine O-methyltransferase Ste14
MKTPSIPIDIMLGLVFWITLGGLRLLDAWQNAHIIPALLAAQSGLVAWLIMTRNPQVVRTSWLKKMVAWTSAFLPLVLRIHHETGLGQLITCSGLLLVLWAIVSLGRSFSIAPADRGIVQNGPYRFIRHPMYLGELISLYGALTGDPSIWNIILITVLLLTLFLRMYWEELVVSDYVSYAVQVRWRMIPGLW